MLRALDVAYLEAAARRSIADQAPAVSERPMTPALSDAPFG